MSHLQGNLVQVVIIVIVIIFIIKIQVANFDFLVGGKLHMLVL
jgi:hypothetical protein